MIKSDLHIHTVLSPCGDIEMTPLNIIRKAKECGIGIIGITDHNSTLNCLEIMRIGNKEGIYVLCGAEITTKEEVHAICFVESIHLGALQFFLEEHIQKIPNNPEIFGYQLAVNENEEIVEEVDYLLINSLDRTIEQVESFIHSLGGIFIPAHIDKMQNSIYSQLGFMPPSLKPDAVEISRKGVRSSQIAMDRSLEKFNFIRSSDAHYLEDFGCVYTMLSLEKLDFNAIRDAIISKSSPPSIN